MNRVDIRELSVHQTYPTLTVMMPYDKERIHNVIQGLLQEIDDEQVAMQLSKRCEQLLQSDMTIKPKEPVLYCINKLIARRYYIPFFTQERCFVWHHFVLDELIGLLNRGKRFFVMTFKKGRLALYDGYGHDVKPIEHYHNGPDGDHLFMFSYDDACNGVTQEDGTCAQDVWIKKFDEYCSHYLRTDPLPIVFCGDANAYALLKLHSMHKKFFVARVDELDEAYDVVVPWYAKQRETALGAYHKAQHTKQYVYDIDQLITQAHKGNIIQLLVEAEYHKKGCLDPILGSLKTKNSCIIDEKIETIDMLIEQVRSKGGSVVLVHPGNLGDGIHLVGLYHLK
jgi:hypothetical protein